MANSFEYELVFCLLHSSISLAFGNTTQTRSNTIFFCGCLIARRQFVCRADLYSHFKEFPNNQYIYYFFSLFGLIIFYVFICVCVCVVVWIGDLYEYEYMLSPSTSFIATEGRNNFFLLLNKKKFFTDVRQPRHIWNKNPIFLLLTCTHSADDDSNSSITQILNKQNNTAFMK